MVTVQRVWKAYASVGTAENITRCRAVQAKIECIRLKL